MTDNTSRELEKLENFLLESHKRIMGDYNGDPWTEHPYQDINKPHFFEDEAKRLQQLIQTELTNQKQRLLEKLPIEYDLPLVKSADELDHTQLQRFGYNQALAYITKVIKEDGAGI